MRNLTIDGSHHREERLSPRAPPLSMPFDHAPLVIRAGWGCVRGLELVDSSALVKATSEAEYQGNLRQAQQTCASRYVLPTGAAGRPVFRTVHPRTIYSLSFESNSIIIHGFCSSRATGPRSPTASPWPGRALGQDRRGASDQKRSSWRHQVAHNVRVVAKPHLCAQRDATKYILRAAGPTAKHPASRTCSVMCKDMGI